MFPQVCSGGIQYSYFTSIAEEIAYWFEILTFDMASYKPPRQWKLGKVEDLNTFENWQQNQILNLSFCPNFAIFLADGVSWDKTSARAHWGLTSDGVDVAENDHLTAAQKLVYLNLMLDQLACYCPVISINSIKNDSTSIQSV